MIDLIRAELLKIKRRQATYVLLIIELALTALVFLATGRFWQLQELIAFPQAYAFIQQTAFQLGGLIAIVFAAAYVGADWNWGVLRNVVARGEGRERYLLAKFAALAIVLAIGLLIEFAACFVLLYVTSFLYNVPIANPFRGDGLQDLGVWIVLGFPVLLQRAAIGFAVAAIFRSQLAGAVVGIVLFLVELVVTTILTLLTFGSQLGEGGSPGLGGGIQPVGPEWFQFLPISIGGNVFNALPGSGGVSSGDVNSIFLRPVPFEQAMVGVILYIVVAIGIALLAVRRQEIV
jgi:ABC-type transport system involved in multi-copper enzyme maturation permease subunit